MPGEIIPAWASVRCYEQGSKQGKGRSDGLAGGEFLTQEKVGEDDDEDGRKLVEDCGPSGRKVFESGSPEEGGNEGSENGHGNHDAPEFAVLETEEELLAHLMRSGHGDGDQHHKCCNKEAEAGDPDERLLGVDVPDHEDSDGHDDVGSRSESDADPEVTFAFDFGGHGGSNEDAGDDQ